MQYLITQHAVEQFIRRWHPDKPFEKAKVELNGLLRTSAYSGKTRLGDQIVISGFRPEVRMVIKDRNVWVTVLPCKTLNDDQAYLDELEELEFARQQEVKQAELDMQFYEQELIRVEAERLALGKKKSELRSNLQIVKNKIERMKWFTSNLVDVE